jgi:hypothetical protein
MYSYSGGPAAAVARGLTGVGQGLAQGLSLLLQRAQTQSEIQRNQAYSDWLEGRNQTQENVAGIRGEYQAAGEANRGVNAANINSQSRDIQAAYHDAYNYALNMGYNGADAQDFAGRTATAMLGSSAPISSAPAAPGPPMPYQLPGNPDVMAIPSQSPAGQPASSTMGAPMAVVGPGVGAVSPDTASRAQDILSRPNPQPLPVGGYVQLPSGAFASKASQMPPPAPTAFAPGTGPLYPPAPSPTPKAAAQATPAQAQPQVPLPDYLTQGPQKGGLLYSKAETADAAQTNAATKASIAPSEIAKNQAQSDLYQADTAKVQAIIPTIAPEAQARIKWLASGANLRQAQAAGVVPLDAARIGLMQAQTAAEKQLPWYRQGLLTVAQENAGSRAQFVQATIGHLGIDNKYLQSRIQQMDQNDPEMKNAIDSLAIASKGLANPLTPASDVAALQGILESSTSYIASRTTANSMYTGTANRAAPAGALPGLGAVPNAAAVTPLPPAQAGAGGAAPRGPTGQQGDRWLVSGRPFARAPLINTKTGETIPVPTTPQEFAQMTPHELAIYRVWAQQNGLLK